MAYILKRDKRTIPKLRDYRDFLLTVKLINFSITKRKSHNQSIETQKPYIYDPYECTYRITYSHSIYCPILFFTENCIPIN